MPGPDHGEGEHGCSGHDEGKTQNFQFDACVSFL